MDSASPPAGFLSFDDASLCAWYGQMHFPTSLTVAEVKELQRLIHEHAPNRRIPTHPLHLMALIQQDHPLIHHPLWTRVFLPMLCPSSLAPNYLGRHLCYFRNVQYNNPGHAQARPDNDLFSKKLGFCLGYSLQVFWIMAKRPFPASFGGAPPPPPAPQRSATGKQQHHANPNPNPKNHFCWQRQNLEFLAKYFGMLCLQLGKIRSYVKDRHDYLAGVWEAGECMQSHIRSITSSTTPAPSLSSSSSSATATAPAAPKLCQCVPMTSSMYPAWRASKSYGTAITHMGIFANDDEQKNWKDLEGALATLWRVFQLEFRDAGAGLWYHGAFDEMRKWEYISLSEQEEQWLGIYSSRDDGPRTMSALGMGLKEAERVQRHWEKTKKWVLPMYPAEWEGWEMPVDEVKDDDWVML